LASFGPPGQGASSVTAAAADAAAATGSATTAADARATGGMAKATVSASSDHSEESGVDKLADTAATASCHDPMKVKFRQDVHDPMKVELPLADRPYGSDADIPWRENPQEANGLDEHGNSLLDINAYSWSSRGSAADCLQSNLCELNTASWSSRGSGVHWPAFNWDRLVDSGAQREGDDSENLGSLAFRDGNADTVNSSLPGEPLNLCEVNTASWSSRGSMRGCTGFPTSASSSQSTMRNMRELMEDLSLFGNRDGTSSALETIQETFVGGSGPARPPSEQAHSSPSSAKQQLPVELQAPVEQQALSQQQTSLHRQPEQSMSAQHKEQPPQPQQPLQPQQPQQMIPALSIQGMPAATAAAPGHVLIAVPLDRLDAVAKILAGPPS